MPDRTISELEAQKRMDLKSLFEMDDRLLGLTILFMARQVRREHPDLVKDDRKRLTNFIFNLAPEVASRLGRGLPLTAEETACPDIQDFSEEELRSVIGFHLATFEPLCEMPKALTEPNYQAIAEEWERTHPGSVSALGLITRDVLFGNPVAFCVDRIAPAENRRDYIAMKVASIGFEAWTPEILEVLDRNPPSWNEVPFKP